MVAGPAAQRNSTAESLRRLPCWRGRRSPRPRTASAAACGRLRRSRRGRGGSPRSACPRRRRVRPWRDSAMARSMRAAWSSGSASTRAWCSASWSRARRPSISTSMAERAAATSAASLIFGGGAVEHGERLLLLAQGEQARGRRRPAPWRSPVPAATGRRTVRARAAWSPCADGGFGLGQQVGGRHLAAGRS